LNSDVRIGDGGFVVRCVSMKTELLR